MPKPTTRRQIETMDEAQRIIENLRKENKNLRHERNLERNKNRQESERTTALVSRIQALERQLADYKHQ